MSSRALYNMQDITLPIIQLRGGIQNMHKNYTLIFVHVLLRANKMEECGINLSEGKTTSA